jgi:DNA-binding LacI/PurR family transcriptional regulator
MLMGIDVHGAPPLISASQRGGLPGEPAAGLAPLMRFTVAIHLSASVNRYRTRPVKDFRRLKTAERRIAAKLLSRRGELARRPRQLRWRVLATFRLETVPQQPKRATIRDVAEATGLSPAAVSYALRGIQTSEETQQRVRHAAAELGYNVNRIARALASGRTGTVGLLFGSLEDLWQQLLGVGIGSALLARDHYALLVDAAGDPERQLLLAQQLRDQRVDGLIVHPLDPSDERWSPLADSLPIVSIGDALHAGQAAGEVLFDNRTGVTLALEHLHKLGHRQIGVLTPTQPSTPDRPADIHVTAEAERLSLDVSIISSPPALTAATEVVREVLAKTDRPTALFCFADSIAYGAYAAARELGLHIPGEVSVAGYDDHPMSALLTPALTTMDWDTDRIVRAAVRLILAAIERKPHRRRIVQPPHLRERGSTGRPASVPAP